MERTFNVSSLLKQKDGLAKLQAADEALEAANFKCHTGWFGLTTNNNVKYVYSHFIPTYLTLAQIPDLIVKGGEKVVISNVQYYKNKKLFDELKKEEQIEEFPADETRNVEATALLKLGKHLYDYDEFKKPVVAINFIYSSGLTCSCSVKVAPYFYHNDWLAPAHLENMTLLGGEKLILTPEQLKLVDDMELEK